MPTVSPVSLAPWLPSTYLRTHRDGELWNAILSFADQPLPLGPQASFQFTAAEPPDASTPALLLEPARGPRFIAVITSFPFNAMFGADIAMADVQALTPPLRDCLNNGVIATLWGAIPDNRMGGCRVIAAGPLAGLVGQSGIDDPQWLSVAVEGPASEPASILVGFCLGAFVKALAGGALALATVTRGLEARLTTEAFFTLGNLRLSLNALDGLAAGDVVVLQQMPPDQILVRINWTTYTFRATAEGLACVGGEPIERYRDPGPQAGDMSEHTAMLEHPIGPDLGGLDIVLDFDLGRMTVPLAQVQAWQPGAVVPLHPPANTEGVEVTVRANGRIIGIGDLVRIDDRLAVRLTRLLSLGQAPAGREGSP
jgi:type III secretion system YscQ/HrcQ family protein